mmetsp:Transcript_23509/g.72317  ORF Transcript_23509/g.72317 Transcript_23509/m.72317 type:complete len:178 (-) Transcript_23509:322-855(-)
MKHHPGRRGKSWRYYARRSKRRQLTKKTGRYHRRGDGGDGGGAYGGRRGSGYGGGGGGGGGGYGGRGGGRGGDRGWDSDEDDRSSCSSWSSDDTPVVTISFSSRSSYFDGHTWWHSDDTPHYAHYSTQGSFGGGRRLGGAGGQTRLLSTSSKCPCGNHKTAGAGDGLCNACRKIINT